MPNLDFATLASSLIIGMIGAGMFMYGKSRLDLKYLATGAGLTVFPYFVGSVAMMWMIAGVVIAALWWTARRSTM
jgi:uncharacterized protein (DUF983 family)